MTDILGIVPARGSSAGIRRKNLQLVDGRPLVLIAADTLSQVCDRVVVSTDDDLIASVAGRYEIHRRPTVDASQTVLEAVRMVVADLDWRGPVACLQPTVPQVTVEDMRVLLACEMATQLVTQDRHTVWHASRRLTLNVNRQEALGDWSYRGVGAYWWPDDLVEPVMPLIASNLEPIVDVDSWADLQQARHKRRRILIRYVANKEVGSGHVRRMVTLADGLQGHDVRFQPTFDTWESWMDWVDYPQSWTYPSEWIVDDEHTHDLVITDTLGYGQTPPVGRSWVSFEDISPESNHADLVVNSLYKDTRPNAVSGKDWVVVRPEYAALPEFEVAKEGRSVLVMFGGTDPSHLAEKTQGALQSSLDGPDIVGRETFVRPSEDRPVAELMQAHDLLITSAGRTVYEAALVGIPTIVLAQNSRETTHTHLGFEHGNVYLGHGRLVSEEKLGRTIRDVLADYDLRVELSNADAPDGRGLDRIVHRIEGIVEGL